MTSFCDSSVACGKAQSSCYEYVDTHTLTHEERRRLIFRSLACSWVSSYYSADYSRFGCNSVISCCCNKNGKCNNLKVIDGGPGCSVETSAGGPVVDASYSMCQTCTGSTSCGWSDHVQVVCKKASFKLSLNESAIDASTSA